MSGSAHAELLERWSWWGERPFVGIPEAVREFRTLVDAYEATGAITTTEATEWRQRTDRTLATEEDPPWAADTREAAGRLLDELFADVAPRIGIDSDDPAEYVLGAFHRLGLISSRDRHRYHERLYPSHDSALVWHEPNEILELITGPPQLTAGLLVYAAVTTPRTIRILARGDSPPPQGNPDLGPVPLIGDPITITDDVGTDYPRPMVGGSRHSHHLNLNILVPHPLPGEATWLDVHIGNATVRLTRT